MWSWREELNLQPAVYKTAALPLSYASYRSDLSDGFRPAMSPPPQEWLSNATVGAVQAPKDANQDAHGF
jgi:hypothetical protein